MAVTIVGTKPMSFKSKDTGELVEGMRIYTVEPIAAKHGDGYTTDSFFLSKARLAELDFIPSCAQKIDIYFNKFGRIGTLKLIEDGSNEIDFGVDID